VLSGRVLRRPGRGGEGSSHPSEGVLVSFLVNLSVDALVLRLHEGF
jgi:hypothetical protein